MLHPQPYDVLAVELSSFQLHWQRSVSPVASACLNVAPDHLDWHGSLEAYLRPRAEIYQHTQIACVYNVADPLTEQLVMEAEVVEGCRAIGFTLGVPAISMLGLVDDVLVDRAFVETRRTRRPSSGRCADLQGDAPSIAPHNVANALAAAALARAYGVPAVAGPATGCASFRPDPHRIADVATVDGVRLRQRLQGHQPARGAGVAAAFDHVVWIAGGLLKGARRVDELVQLGARTGCAAWSSSAPTGRGSPRRLRRHAPDVPVVESVVGDGPTSWGRCDGDVVARGRRAGAARATRSCSRRRRPRWTCSPTTPARGDAFAAAVRRWAEGPRR